MTNTKGTTSSGKMLTTVIALAAMTLLSGCNWIGYGSHLLGGKDKPKVEPPPAQYRGLDGKSVAILVAADEQTLFEHPGAPTLVGRSVARQLVLDVPTVRLTDPKQVEKFQHQNPHWNTLTYADLIKHLAVERLIYVDVSEYRTHERGNAEVWRGVLSATVSVAESEAKDPNHLVFTSRIMTQYPPGFNASVGVVDSNDATIQNGMLIQFARRSSDLFRDREAEKN